MCNICWFSEVSDDTGNPGRQGEQLQYRHQYPRILWNLEDDQGLVAMGNHTKPEFVVEIWGKAAISELFFSVGSMHYNCIDAKYDDAIFSKLHGIYSMH